MEENEMNLTPTQSLDPKIKKVWRISAALVVLLCLVCCFLPFFIVACVTGDPWVWWTAGGIFAFFLVVYVIWAFVFTPLRYSHFKYELFDGFLVINKGIIWWNRCVIPFIRVQNTDTNHGPLLRAFKLASVTVSTAASEHVIPGLPADIAEQLRDRAAELARIAREDV